MFRYVTALCTTDTKLDQQGQHPIALHQCWGGALPPQSQLGWHVPLMPPPPGSRAFASGDITIASVSAQALPQEWNWNTVKNSNRVHRRFIIMAQLLTWNATLMSKFKDTMPRKAQTQTVLSSMMEWSFCLQISACFVWNADAVKT